ANLGKYRMWNRGGFEPEGHQALGTDVWVGGARTPAKHRGLKVLGTPLGTPAFAARCAWALLPRCNHVLRTLPPSLSQPYAEGHDRSLQEALRGFLDLAPTTADAERLFRVSSLPLGPGGLGLSAAARTAECAYWASWADALPRLRQRNLLAAAELTSALRAGTGAAAECLQEAGRAGVAATRDGFACPNWQEVWDGARPQQTEPEPGEWKHGWQYHAAGDHVRTNVFLRDMNLPGIRADDRRRVEVAIDACMACRAPGLVLQRARRHKQTTYPELVGPRRSYFLVAGSETGGRWDEEAYKFLVVSARARARGAPDALRGSLTRALLHRWTGMLPFAIHDALRLAY
ncbi:unnamed protein product, partial [Prorocentrum cordatum]